MPRDTPAAADAAALNRRFAGRETEALAHALSGAAGPFALVSSFGAESAVLLHMAARIDRRVPVLFLDTLLLFPETLDYQLELAGKLGLSDVRRLQPDRVDLFLHDPETALHAADPDACCALRKTRPLERALVGFAGWITGRKRFQSGSRAALPLWEDEPGTGRLKLNPLADWGPAEIAAYIDRHRLPRHPLVAKGFPSLGCTPCTTAVAAGEAPRSGRWRGRGKEECGIHIAGGRVVRGAAACS